MVEVQSGSNTRGQVMVQEGVNVRNKVPVRAGSRSGVEEH